MCIIIIIYFTFKYRYGIPYQGILFTAYYRFHIHADSLELPIRIHIGILWILHKQYIITYIIIRAFRDVKETGTSPHTRLK